MKKRILLSLVSFFAMTAMWASIVDAYKITVSAAENGKTGAKATLTLNMDNRNAIGTWSCTVVLPAGVTFVDGSAAVVPARYPEGYDAELTATAGEDGVAFACSGAEGVGLTGTAGAVATFDVAVASDVEPGDYVVTVKDIKLIEAATFTIREYTKGATEYTWTIEKGAEPGIEGDATGDGGVDVADYQYILNVMSVNGTIETDPAADVTGDGSIDVADAQYVLNIMASQKQ
jgi:hypothetical protein